MPICLTYFLFTLCKEPQEANLRIREKGGVGGTDERGRMLSKFHVFWISYFVTRRKHEWGGMMKEYYCLMKRKPRGVIPFSWLSSVADVGTNGSERSLQGSHCFLPKVVGKIVCLWKAFCLGGCVPLAKCPQNKDGRMCVSVSVIPARFGSQGGFCLSARWRGGATKAYCAPLLCAAECCLFGLTDPVPDAWAHVAWTTKPHSQLAVVTKSYRRWICNIWVIKGDDRWIFEIPVLSYCGKISVQLRSRKCWTLSFPIESKSQDIFT